MLCKVYPCAQLSDVPGRFNIHYSTVVQVVQLVLTVHDPELNFSDGALFFGLGDIPKALLVGYKTIDGSTTTERTWFSSQSKP